MRKYEFAYLAGPVIGFYSILLFSYLPLYGQDKITLSQLIDLNRVSIVSESEGNNSSLTANSIDSWLNPDQGYHSVLINGNLESRLDVDCFQVVLTESQDLIFGFNLLDRQYQSLSDVVLGSGNALFFSADNQSVWKYTQSGGAVLLASRASLAQVASLSVDEVTLADMAVTPDQRVLVTLNGHGFVLMIDENGMITRVITEAQVLAVTLQNSANLQSIEIASNGIIYFLDTISGSVLKTGVLSGLLNFYSLSDLDYVIAEDVLASNFYQFNPTSLIYIDDHPVYPSGYYITQFSQSGLIGEGDGSVAYFIPNPADPDHAAYYRLYDPVNSPDKMIHPTALALAGLSNAGFERSLFVANTGLDNNSKCDGGVYRVDGNNRLTPWVKHYYDRTGQRLWRDGNQITGFYDVYDMAFSAGESSLYGNYLYLISENIDMNGEESGGHGSDLWRIDSEGSAYLFVENIMDAAGTMLFDAGGLYGQSLFVAPWTTGPSILRVNPDGSVETWLTLDERYAILDMAIIPSDTGPLAGQMVLTLSDGFDRHLATINSDKQLNIWLSHIPVGNFPEGDITFNELGELVIIGTDQKCLIRLNFQEQIEKIPLDLRVHPVTSHPYLLMGGGHRSRLLDLGLYGISDEAYTAVMPDNISSDASGVTAFAFDLQDDIYIYHHESGHLLKGTRNPASGIYDYYRTIVTAEQLKDANGKQWIVQSLAWQETNGLYALLKELDANQTLLVRIVESSDDPVQTILNPNAMDRMEIAVSGPSGFNASLEQDGMGIMLNESMGQYIDGPLSPGTYIIQVSSQNESFGRYELLVGPEGVRSELIINALNCPFLIQTVEGQRLAFNFLGRGQARLDLTINPLTNQVIAIDRITVEGTRNGTAFNLANIDEPGNISINQIILNSSLTNLTCEGSIGLFASNSDKKLSATVIGLGRIRTVQAPNMRVSQFSAVSLGDSDADELLPFELDSVSEMNVYGDICKIRLFNNDVYNKFDSLAISGRVVDSVLYAGNIEEFTIFNQNWQNQALVGSQLNIDGSLKSMLVYSGDFADCNLTCSGSIGEFIINNGNLENSEISCAQSASGSISEILVLGEAGVEHNKGNIVNTLIHTGKSIKKIYAEGDMDQVTRIYAGSSLSPSNQIKEIACGGSCAAVISAPKISYLRCGYDRFGDRQSENNSFQGGGFSGSMTSVYSITEVNVTGAILQPATISTTGGSIGRVYTEDGFNGTIQAKRTINVMMVGFIAGKTKNIANYNADVSGSIMAYKIGKLYYTGARVAAMTLPPRQGSIKQIAQD